MKKQRTKDRTALAIWLCAAMLFLCFAILAFYLKPQPGSEGGAFGMLLLDVSDAQTAQSYHVDEYGVYVLAVEENSRADRAGITSGDRLVQVNKEMLESTAYFEQMQGAFAPKEQVVLGFSRGTDAKMYQVTLAWNAD